MSRVAAQTGRAAMIRGKSSAVSYRVTKARAAKAPETAQRNHFFLLSPAMAVHAAIPAKQR